MAQTPINIGLSDDSLMLKILDGLEKQMIAGFGNVDRRFDEMDKKFEATVTRERLEAEVRRLDREDVLNRERLTAFTEAIEAAQAKRESQLKWRITTWLSVVAVVLSTGVTLLVNTLI